MVQIKVIVQDPQVVHLHQELNLLHFISKICKIFITNSMQQPRISVQEASHPEFSLHRDSNPDLIHQMP